LRRSATLALVLAACAGTPPSRPDGALADAKLVDASRSADAALSGADAASGVADAAATAIDGAQPAPDARRENDGPRQR